MLSGLRHLFVLCVFGASVLTASFAAEPTRAARIESLRHQAEQGDADAQVMLGIVYSGGMGSPIDYPQALAWFRKAASQGNALGQYRLGQSYDEGRAVPKDIDQAVDWYRKAAEQGNVPARQRLRTMFIRGQIIPTNDTNSGPWWQNLVKQANAETNAFSRLSVADEQKDADSQVRLGIAYLTGVGTPKNREKATELFRSAAELGNSEAHCLLGAISASNNDWTLAGENKHVADLCRTAAENGFATAQNILATLYTMGRGVAKDEVLAATWCRKAAEQGDSEAERSLGYKYERGQGVPKDEVQANIWYRKAADQGNPNALFTLGLSTKLARAAGRSGPLDDTVDAQAIIELGAERQPENERNFLTNLWASPAQQSRERQMARELGNSIQFQQAIDKMNDAGKNILDGIGAP